MTAGRQAGSARAFGRAAAAICLGLLACQQPVVGERNLGPVTRPGPTIVIDDAWLDLHGHVVATFTVSEEDVPLALDEVDALEPRFTLARLTDHPADGLRAWESLLLTGAHELPTLRPGGPDDPEVLTSVRQPGHEAPASLVDLGGGQYRYAFSGALTAFDPDETLRVGVWLDAAEQPSPRTASTYDFTPSDAPVEGRDVVVDASCVKCHGTVVGHEAVTGVRLCVTCHTWQNADPFTIDPAALFTTTTTARTDPNPLELGRMVHRIHRGKDLPSIYQSSWDPSLASTVPSTRALPPPFIINRPGVPAASARSVIPGRKYSIVAADGRERVFARGVSLPTSDPAIGTMLVAEGGMHPRDLRDCAACHGEAGADPDARPDVPRQGWVVSSWVSRRVCSGCHPEIWFRDTSPAADRSRFPHPGGPQADDARCLGCHVTGDTEKLYAPISEIHVPPARSPRYNKPVVEVVRVENLAPGKRPSVTFRLWDRGDAPGERRPIAPRPNAPVPAFEPDGPHSSYVPRKLAALSIRIVGPTAPDYSAFTSVQLTSGTGGNPDPLGLSTTSSTDPEYVYTFQTAIPEGTTGTFAVGFEARRSITLAHYDPAYDVFRWPYTAEAVNETAENVIVYVDTASGVWTQDGGSPGAVPRRTVVSLQKCLDCHDRIEFHGGQKHDVAWCVTCHTHDETDLDKRMNVAGRLWPGGPVNINGTLDGVEERSTHFKVIMHRIHTSGREGTASLDGIAPFATYYSKAYFFDRGGYPNDLRNCTACHLGKSYLVESLPPGVKPTIANERPTLSHATGGPQHAEAEAVPPLQAACLGCHATGATFSHVARYTAGGVETCDRCHVKGPVSVDVAHGLAPAGGGVGSTFSAIVADVIVPRCATAACHSGSPPVAFPQLDADVAWDAMVGVPSQQASPELPMVDPGAPERSYLLYKLRGDAASVGGTPSTPMPIGDTLLDAADIAAIEAWIANGAPND